MAQPPTTTAASARERHGRSARAAALTPARVRSAALELSLLAGYVVAGVAATWPRATYLAGRAPATIDQGGYIWGFWWVAHQASHLGNPFATTYLAAPVGMPLGFDTLMPLPGLLMAPVTVLFGPAVTYNLLTVVAPGLLCYVAYRAARLWLSSRVGAVVAGAFYGLSTMLLWQDWYHLNIALGAIFLPLAVEAAVRLTQRAGPRRAVILGLVLGASVLVNQESAVMAAIGVAIVLGVWLVRTRSLAGLRQAGLAAAVTAVVASPQIAAMASQSLSGGAGVSPASMAKWDLAFGAPLTSLFAPSPRVADFGLGGLGGLFHYAHPREGAPTFGVALTVLAVAGLVAGWRRPWAKGLALAWLSAATLALGPVLMLGRRAYMVLPVSWHGVQVSAVLPYTWLIQIPGMDSFREAERWAFLGLLPAALLAGNAVEWLSRRSRPLTGVALALAVLELGYSGYSHIRTVPTVMPAVDGPIAADHSGDIVVDIPFGLRGGVSPYGLEIAPQALVMAPADGHPRAVSTTSWVASSSAAAINSHAFYHDLVEVERGAVLTPAELQSARQDARSMPIGWAVVWKGGKTAIPYLRGVGFTYSYRVGRVQVFRLLRSSR